MAEMMPVELRGRNPWKESTKKAVKTWVKENVGSRGEDHILWGRWQSANVQEEWKVQKRKKPPTSNKQMKKCGEPVRKGRKGDLEKKAAPEIENAGQDQCTQKLTRKEEKTRRDERRMAREVRRKKTKENKQKKEKQAKLVREKLEKEGLKRNKNQLVLRDWLKGGSMRLANQGEGQVVKKQGKPKKGNG